MPEVATKHGTFPDMFARLLDGNGFSYASYDVEFMQFPGSITECDGWLLTGSKHGVSATRSSRRRWAAMWRSSKTAGRWG